MPSTNESANLDKQPYKFGGKEYETMHGLNLYDFEARPYDPILGRFLTPDPLAEKCPWINPYAYCGNNPINRVDPTGMDWVVSKAQYEYEGQTYDYSHYQWMDDVTADSELPDGYQYVGAKNDDILTHMGVSSRYETKSDESRGVGFVGGGHVSVGPMGNGTVGGTGAKVTGNISISADISYDKANSTGNNKAGITFNGVSVTANVSERIYSSNNDLNATSGGYLSVFQGGKEYTAGLRTPTGEYVYETGTKPTTATVQIPAYRFSPTNYLQSATVNIGRLNSGLFYNPPTEISWGLQTLMMFRPVK
jgi:RHS repeat-associated protein